MLEWTAPSGAPRAGGGPLLLYLQEAAVSVKAIGGSQWPFSIEKASEAGET